jgi:hypothetical protein
MRRVRPKTICVYCGIREGATKDHVPPKSLFSKPRPSLVTVPCCKTCQSGQSLDDEYFVRTVVMRKDVAEHPAAASVLDTVHRSFTKPHKAGFTRALLESMKEVPVYSPGGIYLGDATSYDVDLQRLCRVIERITRGLYFHEFEDRLSDLQRCVVYALDGFSLASPDIDASVRRILDQAVLGKSRIFGNKVFTYWVQRLDESPMPSTLWAFLVYSRVVFIAFTLPC